MHVQVQQLYSSHEFHETCHSVTFYFMNKVSKRCCDTTTPESIHTKDERNYVAFYFVKNAQIILGITMSQIVEILDTFEEQHFISFS